MSVRTYRYRALREEYRAKCEQRNAPCWLCSGPIDYGLHYEHPESFTVDHAIPVSHRPGLADDVRDWRPAHRVCNQQRGNRDPELALGTLSEQW